jgi:hypothetical protein
MPLLTSELLAYTGSLGAREGEIPYYLAKWRPVLERRSNLAGFNVAALLLAPLWCIYRKLYLLGVSFWLFELIASGLPTALAGAPSAVQNAAAVGGSLIVLAVRLAFGLTANRIYLAHTARTILGVRSRSGSLDERLATLSSLGGTSEAAVWFALAVAAALGIGLALVQVAAV